MEGEEKSALLAKASSGRKTQKKAKEEENLSEWSRNPTNPNLREVCPRSIIENIYQFGRIENPAAEVYFTLLAIWRNCNRETEPEVIRYLERAGRRMMKYTGEQFVEFLRRVLDFPRRGLLNPNNPDFSEVLIEPAARQSGTMVKLQPEIYYFGDQQTRSSTIPICRIPKKIPFRSAVPY